MIIGKCSFKEKQNSVHLNQSFLGIMVTFYIPSGVQVLNPKTIIKVNKRSDTLPQWVLRPRVIIDLFNDGFDP